MLSAAELYEEVKKDYQLSQKNQTVSEKQDELELAHAILNSDSMKQSKKVVFAGKEFLLNEETGQLEII